MTILILNLIIVNVSWTKQTLVCVKTAKLLQVTDRNGKALKRVENFR